MKTTPREGDYVRTAGMTIPQYHAVAKVFIDNGCRSGEYGSEFSYSVFRFFGWLSSYKGFYHTDICDNFTGRELSLSDLLGDDEPLPAAPAWHEYGGNPSVGTECEILNKELGSSAAWEKCKILFMGKFICVYDSESCHERIGKIDLTGMVEFRPLKSERETAIEEMVKHIKINCYEFVGGSDAKIAGNLYDAGYRRVEK